MNAVQQAQEWLSEQEIVMYWGRGSSLSKEGVSKLLKGGDAWDEHVNKLYEMNQHYIWEQEAALVEEAAKRFDVDPGQLESVPTVDMNMDALIRHANAYIGVPLGIATARMYWNDKLDYEDRAEELEALGVNPSDMNKEWPNMPERDDPLIDPDELKDLWLNDTYGGQYVALLDDYDVMRALRKGGLDEYTVLKAGATVTIYDFCNGAGSILTRTQKDIEIDPGEIYHDGASSYGIQSCYELVKQRWDGEIAKPEGKGDQVQ